MEPNTPVSVITTAAGDLATSLLDIGAVVLPIAATILALTVGWRFAKRFVRG